MAKVRIVEATAPAIALPAKLPLALNPAPYDTPDLYDADGEDWIPGPILDMLANMHFGGGYKILDRNGKEMTSGEDNRKTCDGK